MYSPIHGSVGLLLAQFTPNPVVAFVVGIASHYVLDAIPHGDTGIKDWLHGGHAKRRILTVESLDLGITAIVILSLVSSHPTQWWLKLVAGAIGGILPDLLWGVRFVLDSRGITLPIVTRFLHWHDRWHSWGHAQHRYDIPFAAGIVLQLVALSVIFLLHL